MIAVLSDQFATGALEVDEFEHRVTLAQTAGSHDELVALAPEAAGAADRTLVPAPSAATALAPVSATKERGAMLSVLGSNRRAGTWTPPRHLRVTAVLGNVELDFREARMPAGPVEVTVVGALGNVEIIVPPALPVEVEGVAVLGNFDHVDRVAAAPDPDAPLLRIRGVAVLGNVDVKMRLPGETERDAAIRRRQANRRSRSAT